MVKFLRLKNTSIKVYILKSRKLDFFRINPFAVARNGMKHLIKNGFLENKTQMPKDNPNHFINPAFITHWALTRFNDNNIHVGFTVSIKATSKRANKRNLIRRRLKYAVNQNIRNFKVSGYDFLFTARAGFLNMEYEEIDYQMKRVLKYVECRLAEQKK